MAHAPRRDRGRRSSRGCRSLRPGELLRNRRRFRRTGDFEIITTTPQVDHVGIVGIAEDASEVVLGERLAVATEELARANTHVGGAYDVLGASSQRIDGAADDIKRLVTSKALARCSDLRSRHARCRLCSACRGRGPRSCIPSWPMFARRPRFTRWSRVEYHIWALRRFRALHIRMGLHGGIRTGLDVRLLSG